MNPLWPVLLGGLPACAEPAREPSAPRPEPYSPGQVVSPVAPAAAWLGPGDVHRYVVVPPSGARSLTYTVGFDGASLVAQVWHRGELVDETRGQRLHEPRTVGVTAGKRYELVLTTRSATRRVPYDLTVRHGSEPWELEPNHHEGAANTPPRGAPIRGLLTDDDRFVFRPAPDTGRLTLELDIEGGVAWLTAAWRGGEPFPPRIVDVHHAETFGVLPDEPVTVLLRPLFGEPNYRLRIVEAPAPVLVEPNDTEATAVLVPLGQLVTGMLAGGVDHLTVPPVARPHRLVLERDEASKGTLTIEVRRGNEVLLEHRGRRSALTLDPGGPTTVRVRGRAPYRLSVSPRG